uniref:32 kDa immunodominant piroplasm antigen n=1 Tax=Theileria mutans TaxID=27991 RepID=O00944_THEMU|nr:32 kDa immunodominant piroplasm antigen [Theileria mutans]
MVSNRNLKLLCLGFLYIASAACADEPKKEEPKDLTVNVNVDATDNVVYNLTDPNYVTLTAQNGYRFKTLKAGDKTFYTVDTSKFSPTHAFRLKHAEDLFFKLELVPAKPVMFKKKSDTEWTSFKYAQYMDDVLFKGKEEKELDVSKFADETLFTSSAFGTGKLYTSKDTFKVTKVVYDKTEVGKSAKAKFTGVKVYVGSDDKKVVRLNYFYTGDERLKEVYFHLKDDKWTKLEQTEANKLLHAMDSNWPADYKPTVDKFSPLAVLSSLAIVSLFAVYFL